MRAHHTIDRRAVQDAHEAYQTQCEWNSARYQRMDVMMTASTRTACARRFHPTAVSLIQQRARDAVIASSLLLTQPQHKPATPAEDEIEPLPPQDNEGLPVTEPVTYFHSKAVPPLSLWELAATLDASLQCGDEAMLVALVLVDRYCAASDVKPTLHSMHRLYATCLQIGMKTHSDMYYSNATFAAAAGISLVELNWCEVAVLTGLRFRSLVTSEQSIGFVRGALSKRDEMRPTKRRPLSLPHFVDACRYELPKVVAWSMTPAGIAASARMPPPPLVTETPPPSPISAAMFCDVDIGGSADPETPPNTPVPVPLTLRPASNIGSGSAWLQPNRCCHPAYFSSLSVAPRGLAHLRALFRPLPKNQ